MKALLREILAMAILLVAIILVIVMFFFDYIKSDSNQPQAATYQMTEDETKILKEEANYIDSQNKIVLTTGYTVSEEELSEYKANGELKTGQANPFDETPITDVLYDAEGNAYYKVITNRNEVSSGSQWYGTVSGDSRGGTTTSGTATGGTSTQATSEASNQAASTQTKTVPTSKPTTPVQTPKQTPTPTPTTAQTQAYNPTRDITAPSTDSGNLSQSNGKK